MSEERKIVIPGKAYTPPTTTQELLQNFSDPHKQNRLNTISTAVMAVFTFILTVVSIAQWYEIHDNNADTKRLAEAAVKQANAASEQVGALRDSVRQASLQAEATKALAENSKVQAAASKISADTSARGLKVTIESFRQDQRAWVGPSTTRISSLDVHNTKIDITFKNTGRTPALRIRAFVAIGTAVRYPIVVAPERVSSAILFPSEALHSSTPHPLSEEDLAAIKTNNQRLYVYGKILYNDVFGTLHYTQFQYFYRTEDGQLQNDAAGNEAN